MAAARAIGNRILKSDCASVNYSRFFSSNNRFDHTIGNRILKSNCASVNYSRFFSSSRFDYQSNDRPSKNLEMQHNVEKLTNGLVKEVQRLQHEIQDLRCQVDEVIAHQRSQIQTRRESELESEKFARIKLCIVFVGCLSITGLAAYQVYMIY